MSYFTGLYSWLTAKNTPSQQQSSAVHVEDFEEISVLPVSPKQAQDAQAVVEHVARDIGERHPQFDAKTPEGQMAQIEAWLEDPVRTADLNALDVLDLHDLRLTHLADVVIAHLPNLKTLSLHGNQFEALPGSLGKLSHLESLSVDASLAKHEEGFEQLRSLLLSSSNAPQILLFEPCRDGIEGGHVVTDILDKQNASKALNTYQHNSTMNRINTVYALAIVL